MRFAPVNFGVMLGLVAATWFTPGGVPKAEAAVQTAVGSSVAFSCQNSEATLRSRGVVSISSGTSRIYIGYRQATSTNKNPIVTRFDNGRRVWCKSDHYETSGDDNTGYGLLWDGAGVMYAVFSATGTQGASTEDFREFATQGWLRNYGSGGGAKVAIIARINPTTGNVREATYLTSLLSSGRSNSLVVRGLSWTGERLVVSANAWYSPRKANRQAMTCTGSSPFLYRLQFSPNLTTVYSASADRCS